MAAPFSWSFNTASPAPGPDSDVGIAVAERHGRVDRCGGDGRLQPFGPALDHLLRPEGPQREKPSRPSRSPTTTRRTRPPSSRARRARRLDDLHRHRPRHQRFRHPHGRPLLLVLQNRQPGPGPDGDERDAGTGATGVATTASATATFSGAMDPHDDQHDHLRAAHASNKIVPARLATTPPPRHAAAQRGADRRDDLHCDGQRGQGPVRSSDDRPLHLVLHHQPRRILSANHGRDVQPLERLRQAHRGIRSRHGFGRAWG